MLQLFREVLSTVSSSKDPLITHLRERYDRHKGIFQDGQASPEMQLHLDLADYPSHVFQAVNAYINDRIAKIQVLRTSPELQEQVRDVMRDKTTNTFLWVAIVTKELEEVRKGNIPKIFLNFWTAFRQDWQVCMTE